MISCAVQGGLDPNKISDLGADFGISVCRAILFQKLTYAYEKATPLVRSKLPPIGGFLTRTTLRHLAHARRLYRTLVKTVEDESRAHVRAKLKVINKANRWRIRQDREAWEMRRLHSSKKRGNDFYKWMNDSTRKTSKIGPVLTPDLWNQRKQ